MSHSGTGDLNIRTYFRGYVDLAFDTNSDLEDQQAQARTLDTAQVTAAVALPLVAFVVVLAGVVYDRWRVAGCSGVLARRRVSYDPLSIHADAEPPKGELQPAVAVVSLIAPFPPFPQIPLHPYFQPMSSSPLCTLLCTLLSLSTVLGLNMPFRVAPTVLWCCHVRPLCSRFRFRILSFSIFVIMDLSFPVRPPLLPHSQASARRRARSRLVRRALVTTRQGPAASAAPPQLLPRRLQARARTGRGEARH